MEIIPDRRQEKIQTTAKFTCNVEGREPLTILWSRIDGRPFSNRVSIKREGNSKTLTIRNLQKIDEETYICTGRNDFGLSSAKAVLFVIGE